MRQKVPAPSSPRRPRPLKVLDASEPRGTASQFSECVRAIVTLCRRRGLRPPVFRSPPRLDGVDRSIQRRSNGTVVVAVRRGERPFAAIQADIIEGAIVANELVGEQADHFRGAAWAQLEGRTPQPRSRATMEAQPPARVA